jgi:hypothetical protein
MRILVGNNAMANPGGSETYSYAIIKELVERGHTVACYTKRRGMVANQVEKLGVPIYFEPIHEKYDLALLSHSTSIALARNISAFKVQTCHGVYPALEQPVGGMDAYVSISEEVAFHLLKKGTASTLIRNGIDCERFKPVNKINKRLKTILSLSHSDTVNSLLKVVCENIGAELIVHNKYKQPIWNVEDKINQADLVVTLGRGAYEAMACARNVMVLDNRGYVKGEAIGEGLITPLTFPNYAKNNCSGRYSKKAFPYQDLVCELSGYSRDKGTKLRRIALKELNIKEQVNQYLNLVR